MFGQNFTNEVTGTIRVLLESPVCADRMSLPSWYVAGFLTSTTQQVASSSVSGEYGLSALGVGNRWGFSYNFEAPSSLYMIGGYSGTLASPVSGNYVDVLTFSGSSIVSAWRSGTITNDGGTKALRINGAFYVVNPAPHMSTFYMVVGGGATSTLAITASSAVVYSSATVVDVSYSAPYNYQYWRQSIEDPPNEWTHTNYYAAVRGYTLVRVSVQANTSSWVVGETLNAQSPTGFPFVYSGKTTFLDNQISGTMVSDTNPTTSQSFPRSHPSSGTHAWTSNNDSTSYHPGIAFGSYSLGDGSSTTLHGTQRDALLSASQFLVMDTNLTINPTKLSAGDKIYNTNHVLSPSTTNLTSSWREVPNTALSGNAVGNAFVKLETENSSGTVIFSFGGETSTGVNNSHIFWCSASANPSLQTELLISPWFRQDVNKNSWLGDQSNSASAWPNPASTALGIPVNQGVSWGAAAADSISKTVYFGGGVKSIYVGSTSSIWGIRDIWGWRYDPATCRLTGSPFVAGQMPAGRYKHEMIVANGFLYIFGGMTSSYNQSVPGSALTSTFYDSVERAFISQDGVLDSWAQSAFMLPQGPSTTNTGSGLVEGAAIIYPYDAYATGDRHAYIIGGMKAWLSGSTTVSGASAQVYSSLVNYIPGASQNARQNVGTQDPSWMGPSSDEWMTTGIQLGAPDIKPALPMLSDIYQQMMVPLLPAGRRTLPDVGTSILGYRPGLKGTEIQGDWQIKFATTPGPFNPNGDLSNAGWGHISSSQVYIRQVRLEFLVDTTQGFGDLQYFNPAREKLYRRSAVGLRGGRRLRNIVSGSVWWDSGVSYVYTVVQDSYGRTVGITNSSASSDYAVFTQLTGALAVALSGTPSWFLSPPPGEGLPGLPYIPLSSASLGEASVVISNTGSASDMIRATVGQQLPTPADNTLKAFLARTKSLQKTQDLYTRQLNTPQSGSDL
jgi:hypothetical protein